MVQGVTKSLMTVNARSLRPWLWPTPLFNLTKMGRDQAAYNKITSNFMDSLINTKTAEILSRKDASNGHLDKKLGFKVLQTKKIHFVLFSCG